MQRQKSAIVGVRVCNNQTEKHTSESSAHLLVRTALAVTLAWVVITLYL